MSIYTDVVVCRANGNVREAVHHRSLDRTIYAVKKLDVGTMQGFKAVLNEVQFMKSGHTNLVSLRYVFYEKEKVTIFMDKQECDLATMLYKYQYNVEEKVCNYITIEVKYYIL